MMERFKRSPKYQLNPTNRNSIISPSLTTLLFKYVLVSRRYHPIQAHPLWNSVRVYRMAGGGGHAGTSPAFYVGLQSSQPRRHSLASRYSSLFFHLLPQSEQDKYLFLFSLFSNFSPSFREINSDL